MTAVLLLVGGYLAIVAVVVSLGRAAARGDRVMAGEEDL